jgi:hypothetical protein
MTIFCYDSKLVFQTPLKSMCISIAQARAKSAPRVLLALGPRHFPCKFSHKMVLVTCSCACRLRRPRLAQNGCPGLGARHFSCKFSLKLALVTCPCARRLRRLVCVAILGRGIFPVNSRTQWLLPLVHVHFDYPTSRKLPVATLSGGICLAFFA